MDITIRPAVAADSDALTAIAFAAKLHWQYPPEYFAVWRRELTITPAYIEKNTVRVAVDDGRAVGFLSLLHVPASYWAGPVFVARGFWLDHLFVTPAYIGRGIGTRLIAALRALARERGIAAVHLFADPHARGFYEKLGAVLRDEAPSSILGRTVPHYRLDLG